LRPSFAEQRDRRANRQKLRVVVALEKAQFGAQYAQSKLGRIFFALSPKTAHRDALPSKNRILTQISRGEVYLSHAHMRRGRQWL
jgi:hypothetical protein